MKPLLLLLFVFYAGFGIGQHNTGGILPGSGNESYLDITDSTIKKELGLIVLKGTEKTRITPIANDGTLKQIRLYHCSDTSIYFTNPDFFGSYLGIHVNVSGAWPKLKLTEIFVGYNHQLVYVPDTALMDIVSPTFCQPKPVKRKQFTTQACDVYEAKKTHNIYIHMVNQEENNRFEVTWIIHHRKYYGRVIDRL